MPCAERCWLLPSQCKHLSHDIPAHIPAHRDCREPCLCICHLFNDPQNHVPLRGGRLHRCWGSTPPISKHRIAVSPRGRKILAQCSIALILEQLNTHDYEVTEHRIHSLSVKTNMPISPSIWIGSAVFYDQSTPQVLRGS